MLSTKIFEDFFFSSLQFFLFRVSLSNVSLSFLFVSVLPRLSLFLQRFSKDFISSSHRCGKILRFKRKKRAEEETFIVVVVVQNNSPLLLLLEREEEKKGRK